MKIIAVAGGSGSGKSLFSQYLLQKLKRSVILSLDHYYLDRPESVPTENYDFDSPQAFDFRLYQRHLDELVNGKPVRIPAYNYVKGKREREFTKNIPGEYLILEGLHVLMHPSIRSRLSYSFFLDTPLDVAACRRCLRDIREYHLSAEYSLNQYLTFARPVYYTHILPTKQFASLVVENNYGSRLDLFLDDFLRTYPI